MTDSDSNKNLDTAHNESLVDSGNLTATIISQTVQINQQCIDDLSNVLTTQSDAERILSGGFIGLQSLTAELLSMIEKLMVQVESTESGAEQKISLDDTQQALDKLCGQGKLVQEKGKLVVNSEDVIRGLQFGDINGQSIAFTVKTLTVYNSLLHDMLDDKNQLDLQKIGLQLAALQEYRTNEKNPVTATTVSAGDAELF